MRLHTTGCVAMATALAAALLLGACGDDDDTTAGNATGESTTEAAGESPTEGGDDESTSAAAGSDTATASTELCTAYTEVTAAFNGPEPDPEAIIANLDTLEAEAPEEISEPLGVMITAARTVLDSGGEDFSAFEAPEFGEAQGEVDPYMFESCDFEAKVEVSATDYAFDGLEEEMAAGQTAFLLTNDGQEGHELSIVRKKDGVTESFDEILQLGEEEGQAKVDQVAGTFAPRNGSQGLAIADLEPGEYLAICFIPVGTTFPETGEPTEGEGPPHFMEGMKVEFTVA